MADTSSKKTNLTVQNNHPMKPRINFIDPILGSIVLTYLSLEDIEKLESAGKLTPRDFIVQVITHLLEQPMLTTQQIQSLSDETLRNMCLQLAQYENYFSKHFIKRTDDTVFEDLQNAFFTSQKARTESMEMLAKSIERQFSDYQKLLSPISSAFGEFQKIQKIVDTQAFSQAIKHATDMQNLMDNIPQIGRYSLPSVKLSSVVSPRLRYTLPELKERQTESEIHTVSFLLTQIDERLEMKRLGAWDALRGSSRDKMAQAISSMREVFRQTLDLLAPEIQVTSAPWYQKPKAGSPVTRKMRVRFALTGNNLEYSESTVELIVSFGNVADAVYSKLSAEEHGVLVSSPLQVEACLHAVESALFLLLTNRR